MTWSLHAEVAGKRGNKPALVLIHGVAGSLHIWDPVYAALAAQYQTIRFDLLGYGYSPKPRVRYTPQEHVAAIRDTLRAQGIEPPYTLVGLSMGVTLVLEYAALFPDEVDSIVAIGYPYYETHAQARRGLRGSLWTGLTIRHPLLAQLIVPPIWTLGRIGVIPPKWFAGIYSPLMARDTLRNPYRVFRSNVWNSMVNIDARQLVGASKNKRRLFIHGSNDAWAPAADVRQAVSEAPRTTFIEIPNAEHNLVVLKPDDVARYILDFTKD